MKTYKNFLNVSEKYDMNYYYGSTRYYTNFCEEKLLEEVDKLIPDQIINDVDPLGEEYWDECNISENLNPLIVDIISEYLKTWNPFELHFRDEVETWMDRYSLEDIKNKIKMWTGYYLMDDGDLSLINNKLMPARQGHGNISQLGSSLWILEKLGNKIPCVIVKDGKHPKVIKECNTFLEAMEKFDSAIKEFDAPGENCDLDSCLVIGKLSIKILPKNPV